MKLTRRAVIQGALAGAAAGGFGLRPQWLHAEVDLGGMTVDTLSDGYLVLPPEFIFGPMPQEELAQVLAASGVSPNAPLHSDCNVTLLRAGDNVVLFDTGSGPSFQATSGKIAEAMDAIGLAPEEVTHVVFTHGHPDHLWGVLDDFDEPYFPDARHMIGKREWDYWMDPETVDSIGAERTAFAVGAQRRLSAMETAMDFFEDGAEILPGVAARMTPGHTPGHMSFEIRSGSESLMVLGDAIVNGHVGFARPGWPSGSDQDLAMAAETRVALLDQLTADRMRLIGFHLPGGGIGHAERTDDGYRFVPEEG